MQYSKGAKGIKNHYKKYVDLAFEYHVAALSLWTSVVESPFLYNPCMFLARHTIELLLKGLVYRDCGNCVGAKIGIGREKRPVDSTHDLSMLWDYYAENMQPRLFPSPDDIKKLGKAIKRISNRDVDSTKYRYPETKKPYSKLRLEPIVIETDSAVLSELRTRPPILASSESYKTGAIVSGAADFKRGYETFELIEVLFQLADS